MMKQETCTGTPRYLLQQNAHHDISYAKISQIIKNDYTKQEKTTLHAHPHHSMQNNTKNKICFRCHSHK